MKFRDRAAIDLALLGPGYGLGNRNASDAGADGGDIQPGTVQPDHRILEPGAFVAHQIGGRDRAIVEMQLPDMSAAQAMGRLDLARRETRRSRVNHDGADAFVFRLGIRVGYAIEHDEIGIAAVRDEVLGARDAVGVAILRRAHAHVRRIRSAARFGHAVSAQQLARCSLGQVFALQLFIGPDLDRVGRHVMRSHCGCGRRARPRHRLDSQIERNRRYAGPAEFFRQVQAHQPKLGHRLKMKARKNGGFVDFFGLGRKNLVRKPLDRVLQRDIVFGYPDVQHLQLSSICPPTTPFFFKVSIRSRG